MTTEWWNLASAVIGGVIGALAGGIPAWFIAKRQLAETLKRDRDARTREEKTCGYRVFVKLLTIINSVRELHTYIETSIASADAAGLGHMELWQRVRPMVGFTDELTIQFEAEEAAIFLSAKQGAYLMDLLLLGRRHAALMSAFQAYCVRREAYRDRAPVPEEYRGEVGSRMLNEEQLRREQMYTIPLESVITELRLHSASDWKLARSVAERFGPILRSYFGDKAFPAFDLPPEEDGALAEAEMI